MWQNSDLDYDSVRDIQPERRLKGGTGAMEGETQYVTTGQVSTFKEDLWGIIVITFSYQFGMWAWIQRSYLHLF